MGEWPRSARGSCSRAPLRARRLAAPSAIAYESEPGLAPGQIGFLAGATGLGFAFLGPGSWASGRWGRLRAPTLFDVLGSVLPFALPALSRSPGEPGEAALAVLPGSTAQGAQAGFQGLSKPERKHPQTSSVRPG